MWMFVGGVWLGFCGALIVWGERWQLALENRRLQRHTCHTRCSESRWCACGCRDGLYGDATGTRCVVCGTQIVGAEITQPIEIIPQRQTTWGWRREKQERIRQQLEWERFRSEEHTSELQSLMRNSYAVFC